MDIAALAQSLPASRADSPLSGAEHVRGFGIPALPFASGHVLALRVFAQTDFGPYRSLWHRDPAGAWTIFVDGVAVGEACPRYRLSLDWRGPAELFVAMDDPPLEWNVKMGGSPMLAAMNVVLPHITDKVWRRPLVPRMFERLAKHFLGDADMLAMTPNGHRHLLAPQRMFLIVDSRAVLAGEDLGKPIRARENPRIGPWRLPARPVLAMGRGFFEPAAR